MLFITWHLNVLLFCHHFTIGFYFDFKQIKMCYYFDMKRNQMCFNFDKGLSWLGSCQFRGNLLLIVEGVSLVISKL